MKKYVVKVLEEASPQVYVSMVIYETNDLELAQTIAYEQGGHVEEKRVKNEFKTN